MIELTIKRTNGEIEKVQREGGMNSLMFEKMQEATKNAGRGDILKWEYVDTRTDEEKAEMAKEEEIERIKAEMKKCQDYDNKKYIQLREQLYNLK